MTDEQRETCDLLADTMKEEARLHRLVEEAKGDAKRASEVAGELAHQLAEEKNAAIKEMLKRGAERDRLKGELAEAVKRADALESLVDTERQSRKETENTLFFVRKDLQKIKGDLAEARRRVIAAEKLLHDRPFLDGPDEYRREWNGNVVDYIQKYGWLAATPAEHAQPTGRDLDICARLKCESPRHYNIHDPERGGHVFVEPAEQAQGEAARNELKAKTMSITDDVDNEIELAFDKGVAHERFRKRRTIFWVARMLRRYGKGCSDTAEGEWFALLAGKLEETTRAPGKPKKARRR